MKRQDKKKRETNLYFGGLPRLPRTRALRKDTEPCRTGLRRSVVAHVPDHSTAVLADDLERRLLVVLRMWENKTNINTAVYDMICCTEYQVYTVQYSSRNIFTEYRQKKWS